MSLIDKIKNTTFRGLENYDIPNFCTLHSIGLDLGITSYKQSIKYFIKALFFEEFKYKYKCNNENKILFFYSNYYYRQDHFDTFMKFAKRIEIGDVLYPIKKKRKLKFILGIRNFVSVLPWIADMRNRNLSFQEKITILAVLHEINEFKKIMSTFKLSKYNLLVVYYDVNPIENMLVQHFKSLDKKTATLQHGTFTAEKLDVNDVEYMGIELKNSTSDYFLAWNQMTKDEGMMSGIDGSRIKVLGIPKYINTIVKTELSNKNQKTFGVVLGTKSSDKQNIELVKIANEISTRLGYKYMLKYHPTFNLNEYKFYTNTNYLGSFEKYMSIQEYSDSVDFTLVGNSSVYIELIFLKHRTYRLSSKDIIDKFDVIETNRFSDSEELYDIINNSNDNVTEELFNYLCTTEDVYESYMNFFRSFI